VHMAAHGYAKLAGSCVGLAESCMTLFTGEKRGWVGGRGERGGRDSHGELPSPEAQVAVQGGVGNG
jgi:hypothetical protein